MSSGASWLPLVGKWQEWRDEGRERGRREEKGGREGTRDGKK